MEKFVGDDRVVHPHASLVEDPHDRLLRAEPFGEADPLPGDRAGDHHLLVRGDVGEVVPDLPPLHPLLQSLEEEVVREVLAPERAERDAGLCQTGVQVQHPDQSGPGAAPVGDGEDGALVREQSGEHMMAVLPDRLGDDHRCVGRNGPEHFDAVLLTVDEPVTFRRIERVCAADLAAEALHGAGQEFLHGGLGLFTVAICGRTEVAAGDEMDGFHVRSLCGNGPPAAGMRRGGSRSGVGMAETYDNPSRNSTPSLTFPAGVSTLVEFPLPPRRHVMTSRSVRRPLRIINSVAPIRIVDNGGWTDTWFAGHGKIFNIGVYPYAEVQIEVFPRGKDPERVLVQAENYGDSYRVAPGKRSWSKHPLLEAAIQYMKVPKDISVEVSIFSEAPAGASTGTSAAVSVALIGALDLLTPGRMTPHEVAYAAHHIEMNMLGFQCGIQDQLCSAYGGINYIEMTGFPACDGVADPGAELDLVGTGAAPAPDLPGALPQLLRRPSEGHRGARARGSGEPEDRRSSEDGGTVAGRDLRRGFPCIRQGHDRQYGGPGAAAS